MVQVLHRLPKTAHPDLLVGTELFDDAGVFRLDGETALVQTLDFFPPLVDDPFTFGQIAAANALSDVYAMGGRPLTALNIVGFPDQDLSAELLVEILRGGAETGSPKLKWLWSAATACAMQKSSTASRSPASFIRTASAVTPAPSPATSSCLPNPSAAAC